eukprot:1160969-Pelagomonas_calceolata.AAC.6
MCTKSCCNDIQIHGIHQLTLTHRSNSDPWTNTEACLKGEGDAAWAMQCQFCLGLHPLSYKCLPPAGCPRVPPTQNLISLDQRRTLNPQYWASHSDASCKGFGNPIPSPNNESVMLCKLGHKKRHIKNLQVHLAVLKGVPTIVIDCERREKREGKQRGQDNLRHCFCVSTEQKTTNRGARIPVHKNTNAQ